MRALSSPVSQLLRATIPVSHHLNFSVVLSPTTPCRPTSLSLRLFVLATGFFLAAPFPVCAHQVSKLRPSLAGSLRHHAESSFSRTDRQSRRRLLSTPPSGYFSPGDAVAFGFRPVKRLVERGLTSFSDVRSGARARTSSSAHWGHSGVRTSRPHIGANRAPLPRRQRLADEDVRAPPVLRRTADGTPLPRRQRLADEGVRAPPVLPDCRRSTAASTAAAPPVLRRSADASSAHWGHSGVRTSRPHIGASGAPLPRRQRLADEGVRAPTCSLSECGRLVRTLGQTEHRCLDGSGSRTRASAPHLFSVGVRTPRPHIGGTVGCGRPVRTLGQTEHRGRGVRAPPRPAHDTMRP